MFDSIGVIADYVSPHWLAEYFPGRSRTSGGVGRACRPRKARPMARADPGGRTVREGPGTGSRAGQRARACRRRGKLHDVLLAPPGTRRNRRCWKQLATECRSAVPLAVRVRGAAGEALHVLEAQVHIVCRRPARRPATGPGADRGDPWSAQPREEPDRRARRCPCSFLTDDAPRYALVIAGGWLLLTDADRWRDGQVPGAGRGDRACPRR